MDARGFDGAACDFLQSLHLTESESHCRLRAKVIECGAISFQRAQPAAVAHVDRAHVHALASDVLHQLRRRIEAHRLRVEQAAEQGCRFVAFQP